MILYHFTIERYVDSIREHGLLSIADKQRMGMYPAGWTPAPESFEGENELVWLTRDPHANAGIQGFDPVYRIAVEVDAKDVTGWFALMAQRNVPGIVRKSYRVAALKLSPTNRDVDWFVLEGSIPPGAIVAVEPVEVLV